MRSPVLPDHTPEKKHLDDELISQLSALVASRMGLHFPRGSRRELERGVCSAASDFGFSDGEACARWLVATPLTQQQIDTLASHLTIGETYFFRHQESFDAIAQHILPALIAARRKGHRSLRIWSAACCTGEEPYSLAILLHQAIPDLQDWQITILATDINARFLQRAAEAVYGDWSFRGVPASLKDQYFTRTKIGEYQIVPHIRKMVTFSYFNLAEDRYPTLLQENGGAMDLILCRNVMIYFTSHQVRKVMHELYQSLIPGGWLVTSPVETTNGFNTAFSIVNYPSASVLHKAISNKAEQTPPAPPQPPPADLVTLARQFQTATRLPISAGSHPATPVQPRKTAVPKPAPQANLSSGYDQAQALFRAARYKEAITALQTLVTSATISDGSVEALLARSFANIGQHTEASEWCARALTKDKVNAGYHYLSATILLEQQLLSEAEVALKRTLFLQHDFVLAHYTLGMLAHQQGRPGEAQKCFRNTLKLLSHYQQEDLLPESDGITAGRLADMITLLLPGDDR